MSFYDIDWSKKVSEIEIFIAKPNKQIITKVIEADEKSQSIKLANINELKFRVPYKIEIDHVVVDNPNIELIKDRYLVKAKVGLSEEWYVIRNILDSGEDGQESKTVTAYLLPYEMSDKLITAYSEQGVNLRQVLEGGTATDSAGITRQVEGVLSSTNWSIGYVDSSFVTTFRSFDVTSASVLDFVFQVADSYKAVITWDTVNLLINFYKTDSVGINRGLTLSYGKYLKSISRESNSDEMVTRFKSQGQDGLTISGMTPTGQNYIEDFSYFMYPFSVEGEFITQSSYYMSDELCVSILAYNDLVESKNVNFQSLLAQKTSLRSETTILENEKSVLDEQLSVILDQIDIAKSNGQSTVSLESQRVSKQSEVDAKQTLINTKNASIASINSQIATIQSDLDIENSFSPELIKERNNFIIEKEWSDTNIFDEVSLYNETVKRFNELKQPKVIINISLINFLKVVESQIDHDKINIGDIINIHYDRLGINVQSKIIEIGIDWEGEDISLTIANTKEIESDEDKLIKMLYNGNTTSTTVDMSKFKWNNISDVMNQVDQIINNSWDALKNSILAGVNNTVEISGRGMIVRNSDIAKANEYLIIQNGVLAITNDNGNTWKNAITANGIIAERILGKLFVGTNLQIDASDSQGVKTFTVDANGVTIAGAKLTITGGLPANQLNPDFKNSLVNLNTIYNGVVIDSTNGLAITRSDNSVRSILNATTGFAFQKNLGSGTWQDMISYDPTSGNLSVDGTINARQLKLNGVNVLAGSTTISGQFIDKIKANQIDVTTAKITTAQIESLVVGGNVTMGSNATISWSKVTGQPYIPTTTDINNISATKITSTLVSAPVIQGATIQGGTISSNAQIDVGTNLFVGDNIYLTRGSTGVQKIVSAGTGSITFKSNIMTISHIQQIDLQCNYVTLNGSPLSSVATFG